jgi:hypothetical protein
LSLDRSLRRPACGTVWTELTPINSRGAHFMLIACDGCDH